MIKKQSGRPTDPNKDRAILIAARELLFEQGPIAVTMEGVAIKANVSKGTIYSRYANRNELLKIVVVEESKSITLSIGATPNTMQDLQTALHEFVKQFTAFFVSKEHLKLMEVMALPSKVMSKVKKDIYKNGPQQTHDTLGKYLKSAAKAGLIKCEDPDQSAELFLGMLMGLDLVRAWYQMPLKLKQQNKSKKQAQFIVSAFLSLHRL